MSKTVLTALFTLVALTGFTQKAEVNSTGFYLNRCKITRQTTMAVIYSLLGKPDRVSPLANTIWTYDKLGVFVYFAAVDSTVKQVSFDLVKRDLSFSPAQSFTGSLVMHNNRITTAWPLPRLKLIKALKFEKSNVYLTAAYTSYTKIFFDFDPVKGVLRSAGIALEFKPPTARL